MYFSLSKREKRNNIQASVGFKWKRKEDKKKTKNKMKEKTFLYI